MEADDTVDAETELSRREELLSQSWISSLFETNWLMAASFECIERTHRNDIGTW